MIVILILAILFGCFLVADLKTNIIMLFVVFALALFLQL